MPAAVPYTSTLALTNATFPYLMKLARLGADAAIQQDKGIAEGVNTYNGHPDLPGRRHGAATRMEAGLRLIS